MRVLAVLSPLAVCAVCAVLGGPVWLSVLLLCLGAAALAALAP